MSYRLTILFAAFAIIAAPAPADEKDDVKAVIEKAIKAHGGEENLTKYKVTRVKGKGTLQAPGMEIEISMVGVTQVPDKLRIELKLEVMGQTIEVLRVFDGKKGWTQSMGNIMEAEGEGLDDFKEGAFHNYLESFVPLAKDKDLEITALPEEKVNGKPAAGLKVMKKGMKEYRMYFDKESGLLVKTGGKSKDLMGQPVDSDTIHSDYKDVQGTKVAMKQLVLHDGKKFLEARLTEIKLEEKVDPSTFAKP